jgi:hypothetical protein
MLNSALTTLEKIKNKNTILAIISQSSQLLALIASIAHHYNLKENPKAYNIGQPPNSLVSHSFYALIIKLITYKDK